MSWAAHGCVCVRADVRVTGWWRGGERGEVGEGFPFINAHHDGLQGEGIHTGIDEL